ncbi:MAG: Por secretion system C-terminal sorting protein [Chlorobi bacterium]|nr:Por secretion system C-terminal sorting protein [Chlorobiota bacterium]
MSSSAQPRRLALLTFLTFLGITCITAATGATTLSFTPAMLDFGNVVMGSSVTKSFTIRNTTSSVPILITIGDPDNPTFIVESSRQFAIAKGDSQTVTVTFTAPLSIGVADATLPIDNTALDEPSPIEYKLHATIIDQPSEFVSLQIDPSPLAFGNVAAGGSIEKNITITNQSSKRVISGTVSNAGAPFNIISGGGQFQLTPGATRTVAIRFAPGTPGGYIDSILVTANSGDSSKPGDDTRRISRVLLAGRGTTGPGKADSTLILAFPDMLNFGTLTSGQVGMQPIVVMNNSSSERTGTITPPANSGFSLVQGGDYFSLAPGETHEVWLRFAPTSGETIDDSVVISYTINAAGDSSRTLKIPVHAIAQISGVDDEQGTTGRAGYLVSQSYPNPAAGVARIGFTLPESGPVTISLFNLRGESVRTLVDETMAAGSHSVTFNAATLENGIYIYQMRSGGVNLTRSMTVVH